MGKIYYIMGKSASGKDTIYRRLMEDKTFAFHTLVPYTTRPMRSTEVNGRDYLFYRRSRTVPAAGSGQGNRAAFVSDSAWNLELFYGRRRAGGSGKR